METPARRIRPASLVLALVALGRLAAAADAPRRADPFDAVYAQLESAAAPQLVVSPAADSGAVRVTIRQPPADLTGWSLELSQTDITTPMVGRTVATKSCALPVDPNGEVWSLDRFVSPGKYQLKARLTRGGHTAELAQVVWIDPAGKVIADADARFMIAPGAAPRAGRARTDFGELKLWRVFSAPERFTTWELALVPAGAAAAVVRTAGALPVKIGKAAALPDLPLGRYQMRLTLAGEGQPYVLGEDVLIEPEFRHAYFPSHHLVRFLAPEPPAGATHWQLSLRAEDGEAVLAQAAGAFPMSAAGENLPVPVLGEGLYALTLTFTGGHQPVTVTRLFRRLRHAWENEPLGLDDILVTGFTPLQVDPGARTVDCVLRSHTLNAAGFWQQVVSDGRPLLTGPVRLDVTSAGQTVAATGRAVKFIDTKPTRVTGTAAWSAGALRGRTEFAYDYDGLMQVTLHLLPTATAIERVQVVIPLQASEAWLLHPVTTQLRHHFAGRVPAGAGKVWDSTGVKAKVGGWFVPYVYLGGPERGVCFAADNDRDWVSDAATPALEIDRDGATVNLRLNLITGPKVLERERRISFALQATPAKPMPATPVNWRRWSVVGGQADDPGVQFDMWGGTWYWGARNNVTDFGPVDDDFSLWAELGRLRRDQPKSGREGNPYILEYLRRFDNAPRDHLQTLYAHFNSGLSWAAGTPANTAASARFRYILPYTSPRSAALTDAGFGQTYMDEWATMDIADPNWHPGPGRRSTRQTPAGIWYDCEPVPSNVNRILWYHRKMYETFADGIYWDNYFLKECYVPAAAGGPAYVDDAGQLRPGVNLMAFRQLTRRHAVMMQQLGKRPLAWVHMTNVNIVPILSFATMNYDWEWRDLGAFAPQDMQQRLRADQDTALILVQSLGLQAGNISVACSRPDPARRAWQTRSTLAVCLPHEIKFHGSGRTGQFVQQTLNDFGYGRPDCRVYRYWETGFPLTTRGAANYALVLGRGAKALIALGNFGNGPRGAGAPAAEDRDTVAAYDAQRVNQHPAARRDGEPAQSGASYTVTLHLDLQALGLPDTARAFDAEVRAGRLKAAPGDAVEPNQKQAPAGAASFALDEPVSGELKRVAPGVFELPIRRNDFVLLEIE